MHPRYLLIIAVLTLLVPGALIALTASGFYYRHSTNEWDTLENHHFSVRGQQAEILLIGDSSLVHGVSPEELEGATGHSAYNLGVPMPALVVNRDMLLQRYLANNAPPKLIVLYLSATTRSTPPYAFAPVWYQGETMLLRYGDLGRIVDFFRRNPAEISRFAAFTAFNLATRFSLNERHFAQQTRALDRRRGFFPLRATGTATIQRSECQLSSVPVVPDTQFIEGFRRQAAAQGIAAAVYLAPVPDCDVAFAATSAAYSGLVDNVPYTLPHQLFLNDAMMEHLVAPGPEQNSRILAEFLNRFLAQSHSAAAAASVPGTGASRP